MSRSVSNGRSGKGSGEKEATGPATDTARKPSKELVMSMVKRCLGVISVLAVVCAPVVPALAQPGTHPLARAAGPAKANETSAALRDLWVGHVFWVRNVVVAKFAGNQPAAAGAERGGGRAPHAIA